MSKFGLAAIVTAVAFASIYVVYKMLPQTVAAGALTPTAKAAAAGAAATGVTYLPGTGPAAGLSPTQIGGLISAAISDGAAVANGGQNTQVYGPTLTQLGVSPGQQAGLAPLSLGDTTAIPGSSVLTAPTIDPISLDPTQLTNAPTDLSNIDTLGASVDYSYA